MMVARFLITVNKHIYIDSYHPDPSAGQHMHESMAHLQHQSYVGYVIILTVSTQPVDTRVLGCTRAPG